MTTAAAPRSLSLSVRDDPDAIERIDELLAALREQMLASDEVQVSIAPPRVDGFGAKRLVGMGTIWWESKRKEELPC